MGLRRQRWFSTEYLIAREDLKSCNPVASAPLPQLLKSAQIILCKSNHEVPLTSVGDFQLLAQVGVQAVA
jgi:hypothetical protein